MLYALQRAVASLGYCDPPVRPGYNHAPGIEGTGPAVGRMGRAVARHLGADPEGPRHRSAPSWPRPGGGWPPSIPQITEPGQWTRQTCAAWVAAVDRMAVGDYVQRRDHLHARAGKPISPRTKAHMLMATRTFFRDCQEWEWFPRRFDPARALAVPRSISALIGTDPRVIADDVWAKLLWAGLNLEAADLPGTRAGTYYPIELIRALTLTWLFSGLRSDEISRLRAGLHPLAARRPARPRRLPRRPRRRRRLPARRARPQDRHRVHQARRPDRRAGHRGLAGRCGPPSPPRWTARPASTSTCCSPSAPTRSPETYINRTIIPALCAKAGVPAADVRGNITSHRARSTIASQLYNAKEPMTLFELQAWLGPPHPASTQHYAKITPNTLAKAYTEAGYFARNVRTIEVLLDRDAVASGAAAAGEPWQHYDLGHGYCSYTFFEQCPHRMACARCDFYTPKDSAKAQLLEAKRQPAAHARLRPAHRRRTRRRRRRPRRAGLPPRPPRRHPDPRRTHPTPDRHPAIATLLPIAEVRHGKTDNPLQI